MELKEKTRRALDLTRQLGTALESQDMGFWLEMLDQRGCAMAEFDAAHRSATDDQRNECQSDIAALQIEDKELQERSEKMLDQLGEEFREQLGSSTYRGKGQESNDNQACLDLKA